MLLLHACSEPLPEPPELNALRAAYEEGATAEVPEAEVVDRLLSSAERTQLSEVLRKLDIVIERVAEGLDLPPPPLLGTEPGDSARRGLQILEGRFFVDLYAEVFSDCPGFDPEVLDSNPKENGTLRVGLRLTESGFDGVFWGEFDDCRLLSTDAEEILGTDELTIDGDVAVELLEPRGFDVVRDYIFVFDGTVFAGESLTLQGRLDFLVERELGTTVRIPDVRGGQVLLFQPADNPFALELRTASVSWRCDLQDRECLSTTGALVSW